MDESKAADIAKVIDYHIPVELDGKKANEGDTVIFGFRYQIFTSQGLVAVVKGIQKKKPELLGIFDRGYNQLNYQW